MVKYKIEITNLEKSCDIAIEVFSQYPPKNWPINEVFWAIKCRKETKENLIDRQAPFNTLTSLKYVYEEIFTYFQEGSGQTVEEFWKRIKEEKLPYKRENKMVKILKRKKIKNKIEFDFVIDVMIPYLNEGLISEEDIELINEMISNFEKKNKI
jgi:hypothetical protein